MVIIPTLPVEGISFDTEAQPVDENLRKAGASTVSSKRNMPSSLVIVPDINVESALFIRTTFTKSRGVLFSSTTLPVMPWAIDESKVENRIDDMNGLAIVTKTFLLGKVSSEIRLQRKTMFMPDSFPQFFSYST